MNYDLAKKLKDAGFVQEPSISTGGSDGEVFVGFYIVGKEDADAAYRYLETTEWLEYCQRGPEFFIVKIPTLSELIEACGEHFALHKNKDHWKAWQINSNPREPNAANFEEVGSTPEEAVANLWLALHA